MATQGKFIGARYFLLQIFYARIADFNYLAAIEANHMIMVAVWRSHLIARDIVAELDFIGKASLTEQFKGAVNSGLTNARIPHPHMFVKLLKRMMPGQIKKLFRYNLALHSCVQLSAVHEGDKIVEPVIFLVCHSGRSLRVKKRGCP